MKFWKIALGLGSGAWKLHLGHLDPEDVSSHNSGTLRKSELGSSFPAGPSHFLQNLNISLTKL